MTDRYWRTQSFSMPFENNRKVPLSVNGAAVSYAGDDRANAPQIASRM